MLCVSLLLRVIFLVSILLMATSPTVTHPIFKKVYMKRSSTGVDRHRPGTKPGSVFCRISQKSSNLASNAATEAKAAKDAQTCAGEEAGQQVKKQLAEKAIQAAKAAEVVLAGKKQILDQLQLSLSENNKVIEEIKKATSSSQCAMDAATRAAITLKRHKDKLQLLFDDVKNNLENMRHLATNAQQEAINKRALRDAAKHRVEELQECLEQAQKDLERTQDSARKASFSAEEAKQRIEVKRLIRNKLRILKRKDLERLSRLLHARLKGK